MSLWNEFKEFAVKGSVIDLAVGFVIGGAFGTVVSSLVANVIMPPLGLVIGRVDFSKMAVQIGTDPKGGAVLLKYGMFVQACFSFLIIAIAMFAIIKMINRLRRAPPPALAAPPAPTKSEELLGEIRDLLAKRA
ncbi:MAG: large-conductance mechanosensitive channel protein MscL [Gammaproteobacteria bacterium]|nr:large-conductance mechanosensitive channel protein MscL [Gammaproteobacteria bacterium]MDE2263405.1 large-conductance mechanosensitive channel protein MscL [Gammaproteobacteria bacterium]